MSPSSSSYASSLESISMQSIMPIAAFLAAGLSSIAILDVAAKRTITLMASMALRGFGIMLVVALLIEVYTDDGYFPRASCIDAMEPDMIKAMKVSSTHSCLWLRDCRYVTSASPKFICVGTSAAVDTMVLVTCALAVTMLARLIS